MGVFVPHAPMSICVEVCRRCHGVPARSPTSVMERISWMAEMRVIGTAVRGPMRKFADVRSRRRTARRGRRCPLRAHAAAVGLAGRLHCDARTRSCRRTHSVRCAHCVQTAAASQFTKRAHARRPWRCASRRHRNRPQRAAPAATTTSGVPRPNIANSSAKARPGWLRRACEAPRSTGLMAARAARIVF